MGEFDAVFYTRTTVEELARAFRDVVLQTKSPGRGFLADRTAGPIRFSRPEPSPDPAASFRTPSDYEVQAEIPLTGGFSSDPLVLLMDVVVDGDISAGTLVAVGPAGRRAARVYFDAVLGAFRQLDPQLVLGDELDAIRAGAEARGLLPSSSADRGSAPPVGAGTLVFSEGRTIEDTENWTAGCNEALQARGHFTYEGSPALPWGTGNVLSLSADTRRGQIALVVGASPGSPRLVLETGLEYQEMAGMRQVPVAGTPSTYAFSPDGLSLAVYEYHGASVHALAVLDTKILGRRTSVILPCSPYRDPPMWSPDGEWILVASGQTLVRVSDGQLCQLPLSGSARVAWWPQRGPSVLAVIDEPDGGPLTLSTLDLATAKVQVVSSISFAADPDLRRRPHDLGYLAMHPDGGYAVLGDRIGGVPPGYADRFGSRFRMAALDLNTSVVTPWATTFVGDTVVERDQSGWHWTHGPVSGGPVHLHESLRETLRAAPVASFPPADEVETLWLWQPA